MKPDADFFAEVKALLGEAALVVSHARASHPGRPSFEGP